jgi:signal transduction histidine kinase
MGPRVSFTKPVGAPGALLAVSAVTLGIVTLLVVPYSNLGFTTYAGASPAAALADFAAGLGLIGAGLAAWLLRPGSGSGLLLVSLAGLAWFAADWVGWEGGPPIARSVAMAIAPFFLAFLVHLVMASPGGRLRSRCQRLAAGAVYAAAAIVSVGRALVRDPFLDPYCWSNCRDNVFLISAQPGIARALDLMWILVSLIVGLFLAALAIRYLISATPTARRTTSPILVPAVLLGLAIAAHALALLRQPLESPRDVVFSILFQVQAWAAAMLAVGLGLVVVRSWRARVTLARLASDLGEAPAPGSLGPVLARATGDPGLLVVYPLPGSGRHVDASGTTVDLPTAGVGRAVTPIVRNDTEVALVVHDAAAVDSEQLRMQIGAAARLAVENERLQAEVLAQLNDLRASRARVVEVGDAERRRLERNLHDGAQQHVLALSYDLRLARVGAESAGSPELTALLTSAEAEAQTAIEDLRELAHGIYPAVLTEAGIGPALWTLADSAPLPVELAGLPDDRFPEAVERTAFVVASEAIDAASHLGSTHVEVRMIRDDDRLVLEVKGAGSGPFVHLADRVGALEGQFTAEAGLIRAEIPCA